MCPYLVGFIGLPDESDIERSYTISLLRFGAPVVFSIDIITSVGFVASTPSIASESSVILLLEVTKVKESTELLSLIAELRLFKVPYAISTFIIFSLLASTIIEFDPDFSASLTNDDARVSFTTCNAAVLLSLPVGKVTIGVSDH